MMYDIFNSGDLTDQHAALYFWVVMQSKEGKPTK